MVAIYVVAITIGMVLALCIALACDRDWRLMLGIAALPAVIQIILMCFMPETQRWLAKNERYDECYQVLLSIYEQDSAKQELQTLKTEMNKIRKYIKLSECERYAQLFTKYKKCVFVGCSLLFFQQFMGPNTVT